MTKPASRREFLKMAAALSATRFAPPFALNLAALGESAAANATDYKALVCVFMIGGNDNFNTVVPVRCGELCHLQPTAPGHCHGFECLDTHAA